MEISYTNIIATIIVAAITGSVASLIAPWANWGVEKRRKRLRWRKNLINECKRIVNKSRFNPDRFRETSYYSNLKPRLSKKLQKDIESKRYTPGSVMSREQRIKLAEEEFRIKKELFKEIDLLERKWGLL